MEEIWRSCRVRKELFGRAVECKLTGEGRGSWSVTSRTTRSLDCRSDSQMFPSSIIYERDKKSFRFHPIRQVGFTGGRAAGCI